MTLKDCVAMVTRASRGIGKALAGGNALVNCSGHDAARWALEDPARKDWILRPEDVASTVLAAVTMPDRTMVSEIDVRSMNPKQMPPCYLV